jgi:integrase
LQKQRKIVDFLPYRPLTVALKCIILQRSPLVGTLEAEVAIHKLSAARIAKLTKDGMYGDGGNLWLEVTNNGAGKSWLFRWTEPGTRHDRWLGLGPLHTVDLDQARELAKANRLLLKVGKDPKAERDSRRLDDQIVRGLAKTISQVANEYFEAKITRKSRHYVKQTIRLLRWYVHEPIGNMPIQKVNTDIILNKTGLADIWTRQHTTAVMVRIHFERIFKLAIAKKYFHGENPAAWSLLQHILPSSGDVHKPKHHAWLPYTDVGRFMEAIQSFRYTTHRFAVQKDIHPIMTLMIEWVILTGVRIQEARDATWKEIDLSTNTWTVPWEHLKSGDRHNTNRPVPVTKPMLVVLNKLGKHDLDQSPKALIFPGHKNGRPFGESAHVNFLHHSLEWETRVTLHGFRSTLRDWWRANRFPRELWEIQVDHVRGNKTSQAYGHDSLLEERRGPMELWGECCSRPFPPEPKANKIVVNLNTKRKTA